MNKLQWALLALFFAIVALLDFAHASACYTSNSLSSTSNGQTYAMSSSYSYSASMHCTYSTSYTSALYTSFVPTTTGNHYVKAYSSNSESLVLEIRQSSCSGSYLSCNSGLTLTVTGFNSISLTAGVRYYILVSSYSGQYVTYPVQLYVGYCGSSCSSSSGNIPATSPTTPTSSSGSRSGTPPPTVYGESTCSLSGAQFAAVIIPGVFGLSQLTWLGFKMRRANIPRASDIMTMTSSLCGPGLTQLKIRQLDVFISSFCVIAWVTMWAAVWSVFAYFFTLVIYVLMWFAEDGGGEAPTVQRTMAFKFVLIGSSVLCFIAGILALYQGGVFATFAIPMCEAMWYPCQCRVNFYPTMVYSLVAGVSLFIVGICAIMVGVIFEQGMNQIRGLSSDEVLARTRAFRGLPQQQAPMMMLAAPNAAVVEAMPVVAVVENKA